VEALDVLRLRREKVRIISRESEMKVEMSNTIKVSQAWDSLASFTYLFGLG